MLLRCAAALCGCVAVRAVLRCRVVASLCVLCCCHVALLWRSVVLLFCCVVLRSVALRCVVLWCCSCAWLVGWSVGRFGCASVVCAVLVACLCKRVVALLRC